MRAADGMLKRRNSVRLRSCLWREEKGVPRVAVQIADPCSATPWYDVVLLPLVRCPHTPTCLAGRFRFRGLRAKSDGLFGLANDELLRTHQLLSSAIP
jgi:hypothetical protein